MYEVPKHIYVYSGIQKLQESVQKRTLAVRLFARPQSVAEACFKGADKNNYTLRQKHQKEHTLSGNGECSTHREESAEWRNEERNLAESEHLPEHLGVQGHCGRRGLGASFRFAQHHPPFH